VPKKSKNLLVFIKGCQEDIKDHCEGIRVMPKNITNVSKDMVSKEIMKGKPNGKIKGNKEINSPIKK
jgi:hypothetical protein